MESNKGKENSNYSDDNLITTVTKSTNEEVTLNWRGKVIPSKKALTKSEKKGRRKAMLYVLLGILALIAFMFFIWFLFRGIPQLLGVI